MVMTTTSVHGYSSNATLSSPTLQTTRPAPADVRYICTRYERWSIDVDCGAPITGDGQVFGGDASDS
ncbi:hypothetical protein LMH87_001526 [Akanthomyces muscarius]|uniref:Uncharacterized protein n=1 Tax=Akanthomyces muscarius TaxID=2231603 RepID=A0A9W8Q6M0_AKAMU|nr:hypothetical protein LMH87_001526 [Akanthomyces muscarius]KAJ4146973.1 hypothetical protein LMH87_001526 [Akanthomyces muscarius]